MKEGYLLSFTISIQLVQSQPIYETTVHVSLSWFAVYRQVQTQLDRSLIAVPVRMLGTRRIRRRIRSGA